jgi:putative membrane-bound dehydrogenase-like protein
MLFPSLELAEVASASRCGPPSPIRLVAAVWSVCAVLLAACPAAWAQDDADLPDDPYRGRHGQLLFYIDDAGNEQSVKSPEDWAVRRAHVLEGMQQAMGPLPSRENLPDLAIEVVEEIEGDGFIRKEIRFTVEEGHRLAADLYFPDPPAKEGKLPAILALHPTGAQGKRIVAGEGPRANRQYALELAQRGYVVIAPDYPSFGDEADYDFSSDGYVSGTMKGIVNHMRCVDLLQSLDEVDPERIGVIGHSLGGHNAMFVGAFDERLKVIVSSCGWTPFHDYYEGNIKGWTSDRYMPRLRDVYGLDPDQVPFDFYEVVAALAPRAFFSASPEQDSNFEVEGVKKAIPKAQDVYALFDAEENLQVRYPVCEHDFPTEIRAEAYAFIDGILDHAPRRELDFSSELPRIDPLSPDQALESIETRPGFQVQLTAAEPLVEDPVAMSFDADGRLYVVEMRDYSEQDKDFLGRVRLLEDTDGDGIFDTSTIFAEGLSWPTAIICYDGGVFVGAAPDIFYFKDTTGDRQADHKEVVYTGFERTNVQGLLNSFRWGLDNRIHAATSSSGATVTRPGVEDFEPVELRRRDFSFDPKTFDLRPESGGAQHGMYFDDWGRKFVCSNSNHAQFVIFDDNYMARNPYLAPPSPRLMIADDGGQAEVYRSSPVEPWRIVRTRLRASGVVRGAVEGGGRAAGYFTGATGIILYRGDAFPDDLKGMVIVGDVGGNIVHRKRLIPDGVSFIATRVDEETEFVRSSDIWFRPVQYDNGPDGCLHILDMYREVIEHPASLPPEIKQHLDLTSGRDRGRLYRVVPEGFQPRPVPQFTTLSTAEVVALLAHDNSWHRETASRVLYQRQDRAAIPLLAQLVTGSETPLGRLHALYALHGMNALTADLTAAALEDEHAGVREHAVKLAETFTDSSLIRGRLANLADDPELRVRYQLAFTAGEFPVSWKVPLLTRILIQDGADQWVRLAAMSSLAEGAGNVLASLLDDETFRGSKSGLDIIGQLAQQIGRQNQPNELAALLGRLHTLGEQARPVQERMLSELIKGNPALRTSLVEGESGGVLQQMLADARKSAADEAAELATRVASIRTLGYSTFDDDGERIVSLLDLRQPQEIQFAALAALGQFRDRIVGEALLERWQQLTPSVRLEAEEILFSRPAWTMKLLDALEEETIPLADVSPARLRLLPQHQNEQIRARAEQVIGTESAGRRQEIVQEYQSSLSLSGDLERGRAVFRKICAACHRLEETGFEIGPNLATIQNRGKESILLNVLDPNREVNPEFVNYVVATEDGRSYTGMIQAETATSITLVRAEKKSDTILRNEIELMRSSGLSLMPEGLEKEIDPQSMADLIEYLLSIQ